MKDENELKWKPGRLVAENMRRGNKVCDVESSVAFDKIDGQPEASNDQVRPIDSKQ